MLHGVRILDLSWHGPGSIATWLLADLGAEVIKVEPPNGSDFVRSFGPRIENVTVAQLAFDRGKKSLALDLRTSEGSRALRAVAASAHAVVDGFRPGVAERLGIGSDVLRSANPGLTYCRVTGYGRGGSSSTRAGHDLNYVAEAGLLALLPAARSPAPLPAQVADYIAAPLAALAVVSGVFEAQTTGAGRDVEASLFDAASFAAVLPLAEFLMTGVAPGESGHILAGGLACYDSYPCSDGAWLTVAALEGHFWRRFVELLEAPMWCVEDQYSPGRQDEIRAEIRQRLEARTRDEWMSVFAAEDVCVAPVLGLSEVVGSDDVSSRRRVVDVGVPGTSRAVLAPRAPIVVDGVERPSEAPPRLGADSRAVLSAAGFSDEEFSALVASGIVHDGS